MDLIQQLKDYDEAYYNTGTSPVSDAEYDALRDLAKGMFPEDEYFKRVGSPIIAVPGSKVQFPFVVGSLTKYKPESVHEIQDILPAKTKMVITPKLDGASVVAWFENGKLVRAATRGDGSEGVDITHKLKHLTFSDIKGTCILRGEVLLFGDDYITLGFKNRRNGVVGLLGRTDNKDNQYIKVLFYECIDGDAPDFHNTYSHNFVSCTITTIEECTFKFLCDELAVFKEQFAYTDLDGIVLEPLDWVREDVEYPKHKFAFKVNDAPSAAVVSKVEWSVARTGRIVPVVHFEEPILLSGAMVSKATGFNAKFIVDNRIWPGAVVGVVRSGEVIPHIVNVISPAGISYAPLECPCCNGPTEIKGVDIVCTNPECGDSQYLKLEYFLTVMGAEEVKEATLRALGLNSFDKLYGITESTIARSEGFGESSAMNVMEQINKTLNATVEQFVAACGIPNFGQKSAIKVFKRIRQFSSILSDKPDHSEEDHLRIFCGIGFGGWNADALRSVDGIGDKIIDNIFETRQSIWDLYLKLKKFGLTFKEPKSKGSGKLAGKRVALTGNYSIPRPRLEEMISAAGGENGGISKTTDILACADPSSNSGKMKKAKDYGVSVISYDELVTLLES